MFGNNPKRKPVKGDGASLDVQAIFRTFQGEGPYTGWPAIFVRLGGCNLSCDFCDTEFESFVSLSLEKILDEVVSLSQSNGISQVKLVVITGGEPFRQPIELLCQQLLQKGYRVQIETNGTLYRPLPEAVDIICSPKYSGNGFHPIRPDLLPYINAFKFIISKHHPHYQNVEEVGQTEYSIPVYVQPMDQYDPVKNRENQQYVVNLANEKGYRISLQTHKILDIE